MKTCFFKVIRDSIALPAFSSWGYYLGTGCKMFCNASPHKQKSQRDKQWIRVYYKSKLENFLYTWHLSSEKKGKSELTYLKNPTVHRHWQSMVISSTSNKLEIGPTHALSIEASDLVPEHLQERPPSTTGCGQKKGGGKRRRMCQRCYFL